MRNFLSSLCSHGAQPWHLRCLRLWSIQTRRSFISDESPERRPIITRHGNGELEVKVRLGIGRQISLRIHHPPKPRADSPIIIFFKPAIPTARQVPWPTAVLALAANATVVHIDYRLSKDNQYPVPIHMTLACYDWIRKNLARGTRNPYKELSATTKNSKIGVCGELVGGSLATMLALTECHPIGDFPGISAAAVGNPIVDWTGLFGTESDPLAKWSSKEGLVRLQPGFPTGLDNQSLTMFGLSTIRNIIFPKAEKYFDPFASPLLFFRTPSSELPSEPVEAPPNGASSDTEKEEEPSPDTMKKRHYLRKYPPAGSDLKLPHIRVEVGKDWVLKDQGTELVHLMRNSLKQTEIESISMAKDGTRRSCKVIEREGMGLWDEKHMQDVGWWLGKALRRP